MWQTWKNSLDVFCNTPFVQCRSFRIQIESAGSAAKVGKSTGTWIPKGLTQALYTLCESSLHRLRPPWASTFVADGKVYIGDEDGDLGVLEASNEKKLLYEVNMGSAIYTTPIAKSGVLYIVSRNKLFAIKSQ